MNMQAQNLITYWRTVLYEHVDSKPFNLWGGELYYMNLQVQNLLTYGGTVIYEHVGPKPVNLWGNRNI